MPRKDAKDFRSARWFAPDDLRSFGHRSRVLQMGYDYEDWRGKPVIAILNTWSEMNQCHVHFRQRAEDVKRGVLQAGGFPVKLPALSLSENAVKPTTMLYRNMLAMETEEQIRSHPIDGVVLMGGCDKTTSGLVMGAVSAGLPMIFFPVGPMLRGNWRGQALGSGSDALETLGRPAVRNGVGGAVAGNGKGHRTVTWPLHDNGHSLDHDGNRRGIGPVPAGRLLHPSARCQPSSCGGKMRPAHRRDGVGRPVARTHPDRGSLRRLFAYAGAA